MSKFQSDLNDNAAPQSYGPFTLTFPDKQDKSKLVERHFIIEEAREDDHSRYQGVTRQSMQFSTKDGEEKKAVMVGGDEADATLIASCMYEVDGEGLPKSLDSKQQPTRVPVSFIQSLVYRVSKRLLAKVRELSNMDNDEETVEFLTARIKSDQSKLAKLNAGEPTKGKS